MEIRLLLVQLLAGRSDARQHLVCRQAAAVYSCAAVQLHVGLGWSVRICPARDGAVVAGAASTQAPTVAGFSTRPVGRREGLQQSVHAADVGRRRRQDRRRRHVS